MVRLSRPRSARVPGSAKVAASKVAAGNVTVSLRASKSQPGILPSPSGCGRPASAGSGRAAAARGGDRREVEVVARGGRSSNNKVLTWYRLPATGGWGPSARAGHTAVTAGHDMLVFGGVVNGERVNELASFNLDTRVWRRLTAEPATGETISDVRRTQAFPAPRAFHASWAFDTDVYVHGGEGPIGARLCDKPENLEYDDILGGVGRDPFAEDDGGAPLGRGRVAVAGQANKVDSGIKGGVRGQQMGGTEEMSPSASKRRTMSVLEDLWKFDTRTRLWERLSSRLAPLGRKGHTATVVPFRGQPCVFVFGGAPAGRRGLSNALYSVNVPRLSVGEGTWERHKPEGAAPVARQGHSLTAVGEGKRLVLFGGVAENGELLGDIQILEIDGTRLSWGLIQPPVGKVPTARHGHSACEVPTAAGYTAGIRGGRGGVIVFGGEGREQAGPDIRPTNSYEAFLYDPQTSRWQAVETGHAFPIGRHGHSMATIAGWTPPSFHPEGGLTAVEGAPRPRGSATMPSEAAKLQWGNKPLTCAVIFGGLNSMYVSPEIWILPLRWHKKNVQFFPPTEETPEGGNDCGKPASAGFDLTSVVRLKKTARVAAAAARSKVTATGGRHRLETAAEAANLAGSDDALRLWQADGKQDEGASRAVKHRRASLPAGRAGGAATLTIDTSRHQQPQFGTLREGIASDGGGSAARVAGMVVASGGDGGGEVLESAAHMEDELIRQRRLTYAAEQKLAAEVSTRMRLEEANHELRKEAEWLRSLKEAAEHRLREEAKRQWREGQQAKARCGSLERLLAEAYELINTTELQHHLQVKSLMPALYGNPNGWSTEPDSSLQKTRRDRQRRGHSDDHDDLLRNQGCNHIVVGDESDEKQTRSRRAGGDSATGGIRTWAAAATGTRRDSGEAVRRASALPNSCLLAAV